MAFGMVHKSFSNFSAWHYRGKLFEKAESLRGRYAEIANEILPPNDSPFIIPITTFKSDLELLKNAFYTDPKDQSAWNYHEWLIKRICFR